MSITKLLGDDKEPITLSTGYRAILKPAPALLIEEAGNDIEYPPVPRSTIDGVERENPNDPDYLAECRRVERQRNRAGLDVMILFSLQLVDGLPENPTANIEELVDGLPKDDSWLENLKILEKLKRVNLSEYNLDLENNREDRKFAFKRFIACGNDDLMLVSQINGIRQEDIDTFKASFQSNAQPNSNRRLSVKAQKQS